MRSGGDVMSVEIDEQIARLEEEIYRVGLSLRDAWNMPSSEVERLKRDGENRTRALKAQIRKLRDLKSKPKSEVA